LTNQIKSTVRPSSNVKAVISRLGFWSTVLTATFAAAFFAIGAATPVRIFLRWEMRKVGCGRSRNSDGSSERSFSTQILCGDPSNLTYCSERIERSFPGGGWDARASTYRFCRDCRLPTSFLSSRSSRKGLGGKQRKPATHA
jgi:hypothetical protein